MIGAQTNPTPAALRFVDAALELLEASIADDQANGRAPRIGCPVNWPETMARIAEQDRLSRRRAAAMRLEARPVAFWRARYCPMVGGPCLTDGGESGPGCVQWAGDETAGFCTQLAAMRQQLGGRPC